MRDMIFVSHANPEDNEFALWLSLQLAAQGYPVWCDLTKLLGGECFWENIEDAIRHRTVKFLYLLSRTSNDKSGPRNELALALGVERSQPSLGNFVIPLWLDNLPAAEFNVEILRRNAVRFQTSWATGLAQLLAKLEEDGVARRPQFSPAAVTEWWRTHAGAGTGVRREPEMLVSNWYPLTSTPLYFHELHRVRGAGPLGLPSALPYPAVAFNQYLVSFAPVADWSGHLGPDLSLAESLTRTINPPPGASVETRVWSFREERAALTQLLRQAWERVLTRRALSTYQFANGAVGFYFTTGQVPDNRIWYGGVDGSRARRDIIGYKTLSARDGGTAGVRHWHFSLEAKPTSHPVIGYTMRPHVLFSDDGVTIWESKERLHRARRSQCKSWWNDKWRDLIAATVHWLAEGSDAVALPVGSETNVYVAARPLILTAPVSYDEDSIGEAETVDTTEEEDVEPLEGDYDPMY